MYGQWNRDKMFLKSWTLERCDTLQKMCNTRAMVKHVNVPHVYVEKLLKSSAVEWKNTSPLTHSHFVLSHIVFFCETQKMRSLAEWVICSFPWKESRWQFIQLVLLQVFWNCTTVHFAWWIVQIHNFLHLFIHLFIYLEGLTACFLSVRGLLHTSLYKYLKGTLY